MEWKSEVSGRCKLELYWRSGGSETSLTQVNIVRHSKNGDYARNSFNPARVPSIQKSLKEVGLLLGEESVTGRLGPRSVLDGYEA